MPSNNQLIHINNGASFTTSLLIAEKFGKRHDTVLRAIRNLESPADFNERNFAAVDYVDAKGELRPMYNITRDGFSFLAMGFTGKDAAGWKVKFLEAFNAMERELLQQGVPDASHAWVEARTNGKAVRINTTDTIKRFIEYAQRQGSRKACMYYMQITKMGYQGIFIVRQAVGEHFRDKLATIQLINLATAEWLILEEINNGMREGFHYKEIYRRARDRVEALGRVIGKTLPAGHERIGTAANCSRAIESA